MSAEFWCLCVAQHNSVSLSFISMNVWSSVLRDNDSHTVFTKSQIMLLFFQLV